MYIASRLIGWETHFLGRVFMNIKVFVCAFFAIALVACNNGSSPGNGSNQEPGEEQEPEPEPEPGDNDGPYIHFPSEQKTWAVDSRYNEWKAIYYRTIEQERELNEEEDTRKNNFDAGAEGSARIRFDANSNCQVNGTTMDGVCSVSEGIGYGMLITLFQGDEDAFRRLWKYSKYHQVAAGSDHLMNWKFRTFVYGANKDGAGSATDADLDVATALILGYRKWGDSEMLNNALQIAKDIYRLEIREGNKLIMPGNTPMWRNADSYNPSYFSPVAIRLFAEYDSERDWNAVLNANYEWLENISANGNLVPDWANSQGVPEAPPNGSGATTYRQYYYESVRVPWRLAWDQAWYNDSRAKTILNRFAAFIVEQTDWNPANVSNRYNYSGSQPNKTSNTIMAQQASLCATGLTSPDYAGWLNACNNVVADTPITGFSYFHHILQVMYAQLINGKYVKP